MSTPTHMAAPSAAPPGRGRATTRAAAARQVALQRRGYAAAVLRALARNQRGRTTAQIQRTLRDSLTPLGLRVSPAALHQLATDIAAGRPVQLPCPQDLINRWGRAGMSCCGAHWIGADRAHCCRRTGGCGRVFDDAQLWDAHRVRGIRLDPHSRGMVHTTDGIWLQTLDLLPRRSSPAATRTARRR